MPPFPREKQIAPDEALPGEGELGTPTRVEYWVPRDGDFVLATEEDMLWIRAYEAELAMRAKLRVARRLEWRRGSALGGSLACVPVLGGLLTRTRRRGRLGEHARAGAPSAPDTCAESAAPEVSSKVGTHLHDAHTT